MDMRSADHGWLWRKLDSLMRAAGDDGFDLAMPPDGRPVRVPSLVAASRASCTNPARSSACSSGRTDPVLDALMSPKEPKTGLRTLSWTVDVLNPATGDDFVLGVKELILPDGSRRPTRLLSGVYPRVLDGLCRACRSHARDRPGLGRRQAEADRRLPEPRGDFLAWVPASAAAQLPLHESPTSPPALHRYAMLDILDATAIRSPHGVVEDVPPLPERSRAQEAMPAALR